MKVLVSIQRDNIEEQRSRDIVVSDALKNIEFKLDVGYFQISKQDVAQIAKLFCTTELK